MKKDIHPPLHDVEISCVCGEHFKTRSTRDGSKLQVDICSHCHPFFTGTQKFVDTAGRIEKFKRRYKKKTK